MGTGSIVLLKPSVQVRAGIYQDAATNWNLASNLFSISYGGPAQIPSLSPVGVAMLALLLGGLGLALLAARRRRGAVK